MRSSDRITARVCACVLVVLLASLTCFAQYGDINTVAGSGPGAGLQRFNGAVANGTGDLYIADGVASRVMKVTGAATVSPGFTVIAGTGVSGIAGDGGPGTSARLKAPCDVALDAAEANLYIADACGDPANGRVRKVNLATGIITTVATGFNPQSLTIDSNGNIFVADGSDIYKISGAAVSKWYTASTWWAYTVRVDASNDAVIFAGFGNNSGVIVKIVNTNGVAGAITKLAGQDSAFCMTCWNGSAVAPTAVNLDYSPVLAVAGNFIYFNSQLDNRIGRFDHNGAGSLELMAGNGTNTVTGDGSPAINAGIGNYNVYGLAVSSAGPSVFFGGGSPQIMRWFPVGGNINTVPTPGNPNYLGDGGPATSATVSNNIQKVAFDGTGNMYIADQANRAIRRVSNDGKMSTVITGAQLDSGLAAGVHVGNFNIANDTTGNIYIATDSNGIFKYSAGTLTHPVASNGQNLRDIAVDSTKGYVYVIANSQIHRFKLADFSGRTSVYSSGLSLMSLAVDSLGNLWASQADMGTGVTLSQVVPSGPSTTLVNIGASVVANYPVTGSPLGGVDYMDNFALKHFSTGVIGGLAGTNAFAGDGGAVSSARFSSALGLAFDSWCHLYVSDSQNQRVRKIDNLVATTVNSNQPGLSFNVDGTPGGGTFQWISGTPHTIVTASPQGDGDPTRYIFSSWLLPSGATHTNPSLPITAPGCANPTPLYQAQFTAQHQLTTAVSAVADGNITPAPGTNYHDHGSVVALQATPAANRMFLNWTGATVANANAASTTITVNAPESVTANFFTPVPPVISASFAAPTAPVNIPVKLRFTIANPNPLADPNVSFTNILSSMVVASPNGLSNTCGGVVTATPGTNSISLSGGTNAANSNCNVELDVVAATSGIKTQISGPVTSTLYGAGNMASASITILSPPSLNVVFDRATTPLNSSAALAFTITNGDTATAANGLSFSATLPAGLVVSTPNGVTGSCNGEVITAIPSSSTISMTGGTLATNGASCAFSINVTGTTAGLKNFSTAISSTTTGAGGTASTSITVVAPPTMITTFGTASMPVGSSTSLSFTINNANPGVSLTGVGFANTLPAGLVLASLNTVSGTCGGGTISAVAGESNFSLSGATLAANASCTFSVSVTGLAGGLQNNTTGAVTSIDGGTGGTASASMTVVAPPSIAKAFGAASVALNSTTSLTLTITNPAANTVGLTGVAFTDTLPAGIVVGTPSALSSTCGGTATAVDGSGTVSLSGANVVTGGACSVTLNVKGIASGLVTNTTSVTSTNGGTGNTATASITVAAPAIVASAFGAATIPINASTSLTLTITNPAANPIPLTGIGFTDNLVGLVVAPASGLNNTCGGTATAVAGAASFSLVGGTIPSNSSCTVSVNVTGSTAVVANNSVSVTSTEGGAGNTSNASLTVVAPLTIVNSFGAASIPLTGSTSLSFTITNPNTTTSLNGVAFANTLPSGLVISTPNGLSGSCGAGTITADQGTNSISLSGATVAASASCSFAVNVTGIAAGIQNNTTGNVTSTEAGNGGTASASITVVAPPSIAAVYQPTAIPLNGISSLTLTITSPAANTVALSGVGFTYTLPVGLTVSNGTAPVCGGTLTTAAPSSIALTGASVPTNGVCEFAVAVTGAASGSHSATTSAVTSTNGGAGNAATASLSVATPPTVVNTFGTATVPIQGSTSLAYTITNPNTAIQLSGIGFVNTLPAGLVIANPSGLAGSCTGSTINAIPGTNSVTFAGGTLATAASCTLSLNVTGVTSGVHANMTGIVTSIESGPGATSNAALIAVLAPPQIANAFGAATVQLNSNVSLSFAITNPNTTTALTGVAFTDVLPSGLVVANPNNLTGSCGGGTITATAGASAVDLAGATIAPSSVCTFSIDVVGVAGGNQVNTTGIVTSTNGGNGGAATAAISVLSPDLAVAVTHSGNFRQGNTADAYAIIVTNAGQANTSGAVTVIDTLPAGLTATAISGTGWTCTLSSLSCTRTDALVAGATYPVINLIVNVAANAAPNLTNSVTISGGSDANTSNNAASDTTTVNQVADLNITKSHSGNFIQTQKGATYTIIVNNVGAGPTVGNVTVTDVIPAGLTAISAVGTGWTCTVAPTVTCSRPDVLASGSSYPGITLKVDVAPNAVASVTNTATVSGGGELNTSNNTATDATTVAAPAITIVGNTTAATVRPGQSATFLLTLTTNGNLTAPVTLACSGLPPLSSCVFSPASPTVSGTPTTVTLTVSTTGPFSAHTLSASLGTRMMYGFAIAFPMIVFAAPFAGGKSKRSRRIPFLTIIGLLLLTVMFGCGSPSVPHTEPGSYTLSVTAASAPAQGSATMNITVQ
ncbi:MAG TPA: hypothetical protein VN622_13110 [Clostridia bacterium]|nr:hypothetical protein [Clostridia bacterium]